MGEVTIADTSEKSLSWYLRSADHYTHRGWSGGDGSVLALCGASVTPKPTMRVVGEPPGKLVDGPQALLTAPIPEQVCFGLPGRQGDR